MDIFWLQIAFIPIELIVILLCLLLPLCIVPRKEVSLSDHSAQIISFCNCFAAGVFLATCFLLLIPAVEAKLRTILTQLNWPNVHESCALAQSMLLVGLLLILFFEQIVKKCTQNSKNVNAKTLQPSQVITISESSSDEETIEFDAGYKKGETRKMLKLSSDGSASKREIRIKKSNLSNNDGGNIKPHSHVDHVGMFENNFGVRGIFLFFAVSLHCLLEGIAVGLQEEFWKLINIYLAVLLHESLIAFAVGINLARRRLATRTIIQLSIMFSLLIPVGMVIGMVVKNHQSIIGQAIAAALQGIAAGTFVYVIFLEILPQELSAPKDPLCKLFFIFFGTALIVCFKYALPHG